MIPTRVKFYMLFLFLCSIGNAMGQSAKGNDQRSVPDYIVHQGGGRSFKIAGSGRPASIYVDPNDWKGVIRAAKDLGSDVGRVTGTAAAVSENTKPEKNSIVIGTIGKSLVIDKLIASKKIDVSSIRGKWESFLIQTVDGQLVVAGSDKRGTIYGIYDISEKIGVSPWHFWADAPIKKSKELYVKRGSYFQDSPKVKYRGIFINDEEPSFAQWARGAYGGINSKMYATVFELLLRLKANYLWPAMWGKSFNEDDPLNPAVADEYGIVMGTSHHEPMMRSQKEYTDRKNEIGEWNYVTNKKNIDRFFYDGLKRNKMFDNLITIGMRGEGDVAMGEGDDLENIKTLQDVIKGQREIIGNVYGDAPENHPQVWAIFTEVQRYYDAGLTVPDDVILLFCDNNWGHIRRTYPDKEKNRKGGGGLYYHIDMNGGPWNDRWINTTTIPKLQEQFNLAYRSGIDKLWIVNVGDLKPKELPIDFIMRFAWNPDAIPTHKTWDYTVDWARRIFGAEHAEEIADIVSKYTKYNLWRKPEAQTANIFSIVNHQESDSVLKLWRDVAEKAEKLQAEIPAEARDAYYQLVLYPAKASAGVAEIYLAADKNMLFAKQGRASANDLYRRVEYLFEQDMRLSEHYNTSMSAGKWKNMMSDIHIGYKMWSMPKANKLPEIKEITLPAEPSMGVAVEGSESSWPGSSGKAALPVFDAMARSSYYIDVFNRGTGRFEFAAKSDKPWIKLSQSRGKVEKEIRIQTEIDWNALTDGIHEGRIEISQGDKVIPVQVKAIKAPAPKTDAPYFGRLAGEFSIPADQYNANVAGKSAKWIVLPDLGRSKASMGISPVSAAGSVSDLGSAARLEYNIYLGEKGKARVCLGILPTQDVNPVRGLRIAVALDDRNPQIIDARKGLVDTFGEYTASNLAHSRVLKALPPPSKDLYLTGYGKERRSEVFDNLRWLDTDLQVEQPGMHTLKIYMVDPEVVLEKIIVNPDNSHPSYFGAVPMRHNAE